MCNPKEKKDYKQKLSGIFPSITTPFVSGHVEYSQLAGNIKRYNDLDLGGYMILGGNGEYLGLTDKETHRIVETIMRSKKNGRTIVAGAGRESAAATIAFIKSISCYGIDIASVITPFYFAKQMKDQNLISYFQKVADESPLPVLIYNSPAYAAGVSVSPYVISVLSRHENIIGMKNSSGVPISEYIDSVSSGETFLFHSGKASRCYEDLVQGAVGATLSMAIYWPEICIQLYDLFKCEKHKEAEQLSAKIIQLNNVGISKCGVPGVKFAMDIRGYFGGEPRLPLLALTRVQKEAILKIMQKERSELKGLLYGEVNLVLN